MRTDSGVPIPGSLSDIPCFSRFHPSRCKRCQMEALKRTRAPSNDCGKDGWVCKHEASCSLPFAMDIYKLPHKEDTSSGLCGRVEKSKLIFETSDPLMILCE